MTVTRTLHHFPLDPFSRQARLVLGEKKLPFTEVVEKWWEQRPEFVALNPAGLLPVLVEERPEGRVVLAETRAVLDHLEEQETAAPLLPWDPAGRGEVRRLLQWFDRKFDVEVNALLLHEKLEKRLFGLGPPDMNNLRAGREAMRRHFAYMNGLLQERDWLAGPRITLADMAAAAHVSVVDYFGDAPWREHPAVKTWYMKIKSRPCFRPLLMDRWPGIIPPANYADLDF